MRSVVAVVVVSHTAGRQHESQASARKSTITTRTTGLRQPSVFGPHLLDVLAVAHTAAAPRDDSSPLITVDTGRSRINPYGPGRLAGYFALFSWGPRPCDPGLRGTQLHVWDEVDI